MNVPPPTQEIRSRELSALLRTRRQRLQPTDVGLPMGSRRRTKGLRREEVAMLAGISTTYYVFLEQGRAVHPSRRVVDALADALQFDRTERALLYNLALDGTGTVDSVHEESLDPVLSALVEHLDPKPAYITGRYWDVLTANHAARLLWTDWAELPTSKRNMLKWVFTDSSAQNTFVEWEKEALALAGRFRAAALCNPEDPVFQMMADQLIAESPWFRSRWPRHEVAPLSDGIKIVRHDQLGEIRLKHVVLQVASNNDLKLVLFHPNDEDQMKIADAVDRFRQSSAAQAHQQCNAF